jgi:hypothetical protein
LALISQVIGRSAPRLSGLLLHVLLDPELDVGAAIDALRALLRPRPGSAPTTE